MNFTSSQCFITSVTLGKQKDVDIYTVKSGPVPFHIIFLFNFQQIHTRRIDKDRKYIPWNPAFRQTCCFYEQGEKIYHASPAEQIELWFSI